MVSQTNLGAKAPARIKNLLVKELLAHWQGMDSFVVVCPVGLDAIASNGLRAALHAKNIKMTVVKNSLARLVLAEMNMGDAAQLLDAPSAICFGGESVVDVAREMVDFAKGVDVFSVRGAFVEGRIFSSDQVRHLATMPNRSELSAQIVCLVLAPGRRIASALLSPGGRIAGAIEALVAKLTAEAPPELAPQAADDTAEKKDTPESELPVEAAQAPSDTQLSEPTDAAQTSDDPAEKKDAPEPASGSESDPQASEDKQ